jgi:hypothetical protein
MSAYKIAARIDDSGTGPTREPLPPLTQRLLGIARGLDEEDYHRYLAEKYR